LLVAMRIWASSWIGVRARLIIRGDSISALTMLLKLKSKGKGSAMIARELALDLADGTYYPDLITHSPGIALKTVDALSRKHMPAEEAWVTPPSLQQAEENFPPTRDHTFYKTISAF
jgi:hypothetical protein